MSEPSEVELVAMSDTELLTYMKDDAVRWSRAFLARAHNEDPEDFALSQGNLIGWFANAIEAGRGNGVKAWGDLDIGGDDVKAYALISDDLREILVKLRGDHG